MADPLLGAKLKIERAEAHIQELRCALKLYGESKPYEIVTETEQGSKDLLFKFRLLKPIPLVMSVIIGDALQNLRTALDYAACSLALLKNPSANINGVKFPIGRDLKEFEVSAKEAIKKLTPNAIAFIKALKPYKGGADEFWRLHRLSVRDRHRLLLPTWTAAASISIMSIVAHPVTGEHIKVPAPRFKPSRLLPLEDGTVIFTRPPYDPADPYIHDEVQPQVVIAFGDGEVLVAEPIIATLVQFRDFVKIVLAAIEKRFFT